MLSFVLVGIITLIVLSIFSTNNLAAAPPDIRQLKCDLEARAWDSSRKLFKGFIFLKPCADLDDDSEYLQQFYYYCFETSKALSCGYEGK
ncbi:MAG: hypothetical protein ACP5OH_05470 [Nitrososphaerota archaeon]